MTKSSRTATVVTAEDEFYGKVPLILSVGSYERIELRISRIFLLDIY